MNTQILKIRVLLGVQHFLVDAVCLGCMLGVIREQTGDHPAYFLLLIALYNSLAFCTQWLTGFCCDLTGSKSRTHIIYAVLLLAGAGLCAYLPGTGVALIALGNSIFHVAGGKYVIENAGGKAGSLGGFVAPGALGVYVGTIFPEALWGLVFLLCFNAVYLMKVQQMEIAQKGCPEPDNSGFSLLKIIGIVCVLICIICRAASGSVPMAGNNFSAYWAWVPVLLVFSGKFSGGFLGDRRGVGKVGVLALIVGTICAVWGRSSGTFLLGQFAMNILMPLTLWQLVQFLPRSPGMAFGLAASVLYPGSLIRLTEAPFAVYCVLAALSVILFGGAQIILILMTKRGRQWEY